MRMEDMPLSGLHNTKIEALVHDIYSELVEDACLGLCFEVHRAVKQGYFFLDDIDQESMKESEIVDQPGVDVFGQVFNQWKNKECECPNCKRLIAASRLAPHLEKCLGMGRNSSRIANRRLANNNMGKSESDHEDNDDLNDNDWSYRAEKKAKKRKADKNQASPRRSKSLKHKNGDLCNSVNADVFKHNYNSGVNYETLGPDELRSLLMTQCGVISEHTKKMCTRSQRCPQHTDGQRRNVRMFLLGPFVPSVPPVNDMVGSESYDIPGQALVTHLQWGVPLDIPPSDSSSSKASNTGNHPDSQRPKKKKASLNYGGIAGGSGESSGSSQSDISLSHRKKRSKLSAPPAPSIFGNLN